MLGSRILAALATQLRPGCETFTADLRVRVAATGLSTYPDVAVVCGALALAADDQHAATNPVLLVEVTSPSTEDYDRGEKLRHYQTIPALREVLIVSHREPHFALHRRSNDGWTVLEAGAGETIALSSIGVTLAVDVIYRPGLPNTAIPK